MDSKLTKGLAISALAATTLAAADRNVSLTYKAMVNGGYQPPSLGLRLTDGVEQQNLFALSVSNVAMKGDSVNVFGWDTETIRNKKTAFGEHKVLEWDVGASYTSAPIQTPIGPATVDVGVQRWYYPTKELGDRDTLAATEVAVSPTKNWKLKATARHLLEKPYAGGTDLHVSGNYAIPLGEKTAVTLGGEYGHSFGFFDFDGPMVTRADIGITHRLGDWQLSAGYRPQVPLQEHPLLKSNQNWYVSAARNWDMTKPAKALTRMILRR